MASIEIYDRQQATPVASPHHLQNIIRELEVTGSFKGI